MENYLGSCYDSTKNTEAQDCSDFWGDVKKSLVRDKKASINASVEKIKDTFRKQILKDIKRAEAKKQKREIRPEKHGYAVYHSEDGRDYTFSVRRMMDFMLDKQTGELCNPTVTTNPHGLNAANVMKEAFINEKMNALPVCSKREEAFAQAEDEFPRFYDWAGHAVLALLCIDNLEQENSKKENELRNEKIKLNLLGVSA